MKKILALTLALVLALSLCACGGGNADTTTTDNGDAADTATVEIPPVEDLTGTDTSAIPGVEDGVLTVGMECTYAPYNWTQTDDSNGAVPIVNNPGSYANGYDVMIAQRICDAYGWKLEVQAIEWDGLIPALNAGTIDAVIAGQSMTTESYGAGRHGRPLLLRLHRVRGQEGQRAGPGQGHQRADRHLHRSERHHLVH